MYFSTAAYVLRRTKTSGQDVFLTLMTEKAGKIEVVAQGAQRPKSPYFSCSKPFAKVDFILNTKLKTPKVHSCDLIDSHYKLMDDLVKFSFAQYFLELCALTTHTHVVEKEHYNLIDFVMSRLVSHDKEELFLWAFYLVKITKCLGYDPNISSSCSRCDALLKKEKSFFSLNQGQVLCSHCIDEWDKNIKMTWNHLQIINILQKKTYDEILKSKIHHRYLLEISNAFEGFIQQQLEIPAIKSKTFLKEIIEITEWI